MTHIALHFVVPLAVALLFYPKEWRSVTLVLIGTMVVDLDHLLADPIYDPSRCSIGFHPLHTVPAIALYGLLFVVPWLVMRRQRPRPPSGLVRTTHLIGLGLLIHMALDWTDCVW